MHKLFISKPFASQSFTVVAGKVIKATLVYKGSDISAGDSYRAEQALKALATGSMSKPWINLSLDEATEGDLQAAKKANPAQTHEIEAMIKYLRESKAAEAPKPAAPIQVEIVNAAQLKTKQTAVQVQRNSAGEMTGVMATTV